MTTVTIKRIDAGIKSFTTNRDKLRDQAHTLAMMIFYHAAPKAISPECNGTGDCTRVPALIDAMPRGWADLMNKWFKEYTPIRISSDGKRVGYDPKYTPLPNEEKLAWWKLEEANTNSFVTFDRDGGNGIKVLDFAALVKMVEQLSKRIESKLEKDEIKPEDAASAKAIAATLSGLRFNRVVSADSVDSPANENKAGKTQKVAAA